jgi:hypothetical protein
MVPLASTATPLGLKNAAPVPLPSANAFVLLPARVVTTPPGDTLRMRLFAESATITLPLASMATPVGSLNAAPTPVPSANAYDPLPASVVTTPPGVTLRIRLLSLSATITLPLASMATPVGYEKEASVPAPSAKKPYIPASVVTTLPGVTLRMRKLYWSATNTFPPASTATPEGSRNEAPTPEPSANALSPLPASEVTAPPGVTLRMRWLLWSATKTLPLASTATPEGYLNAAPLPLPSANMEDAFPASVVTNEDAQKAGARGIVYEGQSEAGPQTAAPAALYVPAAQGRHAAEDAPPPLGLNLPTAQLVQDDAPPVLNVPVAQGKHAAEAELPVLGLYVPAAQGGHATEMPALGLYVPGVHAVQEAGATAKVPAGQEVAVKTQVDAPVALYVPASQSKQVAELVAPWLLLALPAGQALQKVLPIELQKPAAQQAPAPVLLYVPAAQGVHAVEDELPMLGLYVPAAQLVQDDAPPVLKEPAAHGRHAAEDELPALGL